MYKYSILLKSSICFKEKLWAYLLAKFNLYVRILDTDERKNEESMIKIKKRER